MSMGPSDGRQANLAKFARSVIRFWSNVEKTETCWLWRGRINHGGYGEYSTSVGGWRSAAAHRFALVVTTGEDIPDGLQVDHLCKVRNCVNPIHLEVVTPQENTLRSESISALNARKDRCPRCGGPYSIAKRGKRKPGRRCQPCHSERRRQRTAAKRASAAKERLAQQQADCEAETTRRANGEAE